MNFTSHVDEPTDFDWGHPGEDIWPQAGEKERA